MPTTLFTSLTEEDKNHAVEQLIQDSTPRHDFFLLVVLSVLMSTFGLLMDNVTVIIGSMLIAPLLSPILSLSLGIVIADNKVMWRSIYTISKSVLFAVPASAIVALLFSSMAGLDQGLNPEIISRTEPSILFAAVAIVAGAAASFAHIKPHLSASLPGVAISVALIPPLAVTGIGVAQLNLDLISNSFVLFLINIAAIIFASMIIFSLMNLYVKRGVAEIAVAKEDLALKKEEEKALREASK